jgi:hypothetical protein
VAAHLKVLMRMVWMTWEETKYFWQKP